MISSIRGHARLLPDEINTDLHCSAKYMPGRDAAYVAQHAFESIAPDFISRFRPGDIIVAGRNFGMGPKMNGYIAMQALGLGLVCESMPFLAYRAAVGCGVRVMTDCVNVSDMCETGDELEVDFRNGFFVNHTRNTQREYPPVPETLLELIALGGNAGWLRQWWQTRNEASSADIAGVRG